MSIATRGVLGMKVSAFTLTYLDDNDGKYGKSETIVMPYVILGRDPSCNVRFGEVYPTVSRKHAAIERQAENITIIKNLSDTNPTLVNGRPVKGQWFLNNGDTIQLSMEGPRMQFNIAADGMKKMGVTERVAAVAKQMEAKHKRTLSLLTACFVLLFMGSSAYYYTQISDLSEKLIGNQMQLAQMEEDAKKREEQSRKREDSLSAAFNKEKEKMLNKIKKLDLKIKKISYAEGNVKLGKADGVPKEVNDQIYFIRVRSFKTVSAEGRNIELDVRWEGTGFLLDDGRFVTARHVVQPWRFLNKAETDADMQQLYANAVETTGGTLEVQYEAISPNGKKFRFGYQDIVADYSRDEVTNITAQGMDFPVIIANQSGNYSTDWATVKVSNPPSSAIRAAYAKSTELKRGEKVAALGYSFGAQMQQSVNNLKPFYSESDVAQDGLNRGAIIVSNRNFEGGHSGGPVFYVSSGKWFVVGVVSAGIKSAGIIVPISAIGVP
jgi:pSer/pThr/pTyr-binding forkhead associated (FHA) protein